MINRLYWWPGLSPGGRGHESIEEADLIGDLRLGVDLGATFVKMALVDGRGVILDRTKVSTVKEPRTLVKLLRSSVSHWLTGPFGEPESAWRETWIPKKA